MSSAKRSPIAGLRTETFVMLGSMTITPSVALNNSNAKFPELPCAWSAAIVRKSATLVLLSDEFMLEQEEAWASRIEIKERMCHCHGCRRKV